MHPMFNEQQMAARAVAGDEDAFGVLLAGCYEQLRTALVSEVGERLGATYSADDAIQEAYAYIFARMEAFEYRGSGSFFAWVKTVAKNRVIDAARAQRAQKRGGGMDRLHVTDEQASRLAVSLGGLKPDSMTASRLAARAELPNHIRVALARLNENERDVIMLRFFEQMEWDQIAEKLDNSKSGVRALGHRALDKLEGFLGSMSRFLTRA